MHTYLPNTYTHPETPIPPPTNTAPHTCLLSHAHMLVPPLCSSYVPLCLISPRRRKKLQDIQRRPVQATSECAWLALLHRLTVLLLPSTDLLPTTDPMHIPLPESSSFTTFMLHLPGSKFFLGYDLDSTIHKTMSSQLSTCAVLGKW